MSRMAQQLQKQIDELQKAQRTRRRPKVINQDPPAGGDGEDVTIEIEEIGGSERLDTPVMDAATQQPENTAMAKKKSAKKKSAGPKGRSKKLKASRKKASSKKASSKKASARAAKPRKARSTPARENGTRQHKQYSLVNGIPDTLRNPSAGRKILESIEKRGSATNADVRSDWPKMPPPTIGFYLGKFQRVKVVTAK